MHKNLIIEQEITNTLEQNYMPYAMSVIISRALPEIDGLKPSQRKLLYTMYKMGLLKGNKTKSANVVGQTMKLNPHGDMAIYETLVRLTTGNSTLLHPYIQSKGNFGKRYSRDMAFAAPRYTEVKLDTISEELFKDIDKNTVDFMDNYDSTMEEPVLLPTTFPNILVNPNLGIAVGMASNICSFNLEEICLATIEILKNKAVDLTQYIKAPDFSSGGQLIYNKKKMKQIYETGSGSFKLRAKYRYDKENSCIEIYEIPYTTTAEAIIDKIVDLIKLNKIKEITDVRDETDLKGLKITLDLKRNTDHKQLMNKLYKLTTLEDSFNCNFNILINSKAQVLGIRGILEEWIKFRIDCIKKKISFGINKKSEKLHLLKGLEKILLDIDKAIKIIRETELDKNVISNLMAGFNIDKIQAEFIAEIKLRNLNKEYILNRTKDIENLNKELCQLNIILNSEKEIKKIIIKELRHVIKKYAKPRKTEIISDKNIKHITTDYFIEDYNLKIFITNEGYIKKIPLTSLRGNSEQKLKDNDYIIQEIETHNKAELLFFSDKANVYKIKIHTLSSCKASSLGDFIQNIIDIQQDENIIYTIATHDYKGYMLFCFKNGKIAKIDLQSYTTKTNRKKLSNAYYNEEKLIRLMFIDQDIELVALSNIDKMLIFSTENINPKVSRTSQGVQVLKSKKDSKMISVKCMDEVNISDVQYYRTKNIPAVGYYLKKEDKELMQQSISLNNIL